MSVDTDTKEINKLIYTSLWMRLKTIWNSRFEKADTAPYGWPQQCLLSKQPSTSCIERYYGTTIFQRCVIVFKNISWKHIYNLITALFWVISQQVVVISYRHFRTIYRSRRQGFLWILRMGSIGCPETSVRNYHYSLFHNPEECSCQLLLGGSLKSCTYSLWFDFWNSKIIFATSLKICYSFEILKHARSELLKFVCDLQLLGR